MKQDSAVAVIIIVIVVVIYKGKNNNLKQSVMATCPQHLTTKISKIKR